MSPPGPARGPDWLKAARPAPPTQPRRASRALGDVADAEYIGGTTIRYTHRKCGHIWTEDHGKGPAPKRMSVAGARLMAHWWSATDKGVVALCPTCERARRRAERDAGGGRQ